MVGFEFPEEGPNGVEKRSHGARWALLFAPPRLFRQDRATLLSKACWLAAAALRRSSVLPRCGFILTQKQSRGDEFFLSVEAPRFRETFFCELCWAENAYAAVRCLGVNATIERLLLFIVNDWHA